MFGAEILIVTMKSVTYRIGKVEKLKYKKVSSGFTIVELLIVIVVIGILAAFTVVAYNGIQDRALDSRRLTDAKTIIGGLQAYKAVNGEYPAATPHCWESSTSGSSFMEYLVSDTGLSNVPLDPVNDGTYHYRYCKYAAGTYNCDVSRGPYVIFSIKRLKSDPINPKHSNWICSGRNWNQDNNNEMSWTWGAYEN